MSSEEKAIHTYCVQCSSCCPVIAYVKEGMFVRVAPDLTHPAGGPICPKGMAGPELVNSPQRLKYPMKRTNPKGAADPGWERISWDEALDLIVSKISAIKDAHGPEAVAFYRPAKAGSPSTDYEDFVLRLANCLGSPNTLSTGYICQWHRDSGSKYTYGAGIPEPDFGKSSLILLWGVNQSHTNNSIYQVLRKAKKRGAKFLVIDPRKTKMAEMAELHLAVKPGTDGTLALTLLRTMVDEGLIDEDFVRDWTNAPFLSRKDTGELLNVSSFGGSQTEEGVAVAKALETGILQSEDYLAWDGKTEGLVAYRASRRNFVARIDASGVEAIEDGGAVEPLLSGSYLLGLVDGNDGGEGADGIDDANRGDGGGVECRPVWQDLLDILVDFSPADTQSITGITPDQVLAAVHLMNENKPMSYYSYNGIEEHINAMQNNRAVCLLYTALGCLGQEGGNYWRKGKVKKNNLAGPKLLSPEQNAKRLGLEPKPLGPAVSRKVVAHDFYTGILEEKPYPIKAFLSFGGSVLTANPNSGRGAEALSALDFFVQAELFMTPTATFADVVLPAASFWEGYYVRPGFGMGHPAARNRVQLRQCVVPPVHETRPDPEIILDLAMRFGFEEEFWHGDLEKALDYCLAPTGFTVEELRKYPTGIDVAGEDLPFKNHATLDPDTGCAIGFKTPSGRVEVYSSMLAKHGYSAFPCPEILRPYHEVHYNEEYPLIMSNFKLQEFCHGQHRALPSLRKRVPNPYVEINPATASEYLVQDGEWVRLETATGGIRLQAKVTDTVLPGVIQTTHGWWQECDELELPGFNAIDSSGSNVNFIVSDEIRDPLSGSIPIRSYRCRIVVGE